VADAAQVSLAVYDGACFLASLKPTFFTQAYYAFGGYVDENATPEMKSLVRLNGQNVAPERETGDNPRRLMVRLEAIKAEVRCRRLGGHVGAALQGSRLPDRAAERPGAPQASGFSARP
jgi:hypothetical protein